MTIKTYDSFADRALTKEQEEKVWNRFYECCESDYVIAEKRNYLIALIRECHVVIELDDEIFGLSVTQKKSTVSENYIEREENRFIFISLMLASEYKDQCCIADYDTDEEFASMQKV